MDVLVIIPGSYSVKFHHYEIKDGQLEILNAEEVTLFSTQDDFSSRNTDDEEMQNYIVSSYMERTQFRGKSISIFPSKKLTARMFELPVAQRKKAIAMIPFQLEETIPFVLTDVVYGSTLEKEANHTRVNIQMTQMDQFIDYYMELQMHNIVPAALTTELSIINNYIQDIEIFAPYCILDIGHKGTNAYFINKKKIATTHYSDIAGHILDEVIASSYQISLREASEYKHQNAFFLTESQYDDVDADQREFALLMKTTLQPLINEFRRWEIGFRSQYGNKVKKILLMGGSGRMKNINNFLTQHLGTEIEMLDTQKLTPHIFASPLPPTALYTYSLNTMAILSEIEEKPLINFLQGPYSSKFTNNISIHSTVFIFSRVCFLSFLIILGLLLERFISLNPQEKALHKKLSTALKTNKELNINENQIRLLKRSPEKILNILEKSNQTLRKELKSIKSASIKDAFVPLVELNENLSKNRKVDLVHYDSNGELSNVTFFSEDKDEIEKFYDYIKDTDLKFEKIDFAKDKSEVTMTLKED